MPSPIRDLWHTRPGWSEYLAPRNGGKSRHYGFDSYTLPRTPIYSLADGRVVAKGYSEGFGHYVDVLYPSLGIREREAHMYGPSPLPVSNKTIPPGTKLGEVGRSGNARNIYWIRNGVELWHVHSQAWRGNTTNGNRLVDPTKYWGGSAGGGGNTINPKRRNSMATLFKHSDKNLWALGGDSPGTPANWQPTESQSHANELAASHGNAVTVNAGTWANREAWYTSPLSIQVDGLADAVAAAVAEALSGLPSGTPADPATIAEAVASELSDEFAAIPSAVDNGQAARDAIVKD